MYHAYPIAATAFLYPEAVKSGLSSGTSELPDRYQPSRQPSGFISIALVNLSWLGSRLNTLCRLGSEANYREFIAVRSILVIISLGIVISRKTGIFCLASPIVSFDTSLAVETFFDSHAYLWSDGSAH
jgi:hypothetical protein